MFSRSTAFLGMLAAASVGLLGGCGDSATVRHPGKDAGLDSPADNKDATAADPETNQADTKPLGDGAADAEPTKQDAFIEDLHFVNLDTAADVAERKDVGADAAETKDTPPSDSLSDAPPVPDGSALDGSAISDGAKLADAKPGIDGSLSPSCQGILLDNSFPPPTYPILYREPTNAAETFATRSAALLSAYGLDDADYTFTAMPISWTATMEQGMGPCTLALGGPLTKETSVAAVRAFLAPWGDLFQYKDNGKEMTSTSCDSKFCMVRLAQDYCGLPIYSKDQSYRGDFYVDVYAKDGCVNRALSHFVPMIPIPRNVLLSEAKLKQALVGLKLTYSCATGQRTAQVSESDAFFMPAGPTVHVRKSATEANTLEYRLAVGVVVQVGGSDGLPWTLYVDGLDGTVLESNAGFNCD